MQVMCEITPVSVRDSTATGATWWDAMNAAVINVNNWQLI